MRVALIIAALAGAAQAAPPEIRSAAPDAVAVTIYRDDLALITETRTVTLPGGEARIAFEGVLDTALPASAVIRGLEEYERERNFGFDGLTPSSLMFKSIGEDVEVVRTSPATGQERRETARIAAAGEGVALQFRDRLEALGCAGLPERLVFSRAPDGLRAKPTLSTTLKDAPAGPVTLTLAYLATGLSWQADYVVTPRADGTASIQGWLTLTNSGEQGFADAEVAAVAGDLSRVFGEGQVRALRRSVQRLCYPLGTTTDGLSAGEFYGDMEMSMRALPMAMAPPPPPPPPPPPAPVVPTAAKLSEQEALADYQLYTLPWRTGVAARQTKQAAFVARPAARFSRVHRHDVFDPRFQDDGPQTTRILLRFANREEAGLGTPLPKGTARVTTISTMGALYEGEDDVRDTAIGLDWELDVGASAAVTVETKTMRLAETRLSGRRLRRTAEIEHIVSNASSAPATVEVVQQIYAADVRVTAQSAEHVIKDGAPTWTISVPPNGRVRLTYTAVSQD